MTQKFENVQVVGMHYRGAYAKNWARDCEEGEIVKLRRDPENAYDQNAIKVFANNESTAGLWVGFISASDAAFISLQMDADDSVEFWGEITGKLLSDTNTYPVISIHSAE